MAEDDFPETTIVLLSVPGDYDGLHRLIVHGDPDGLGDKIAASEGRPFRVERVVQRGRSTIWLNPGAIAYFKKGHRSARWRSPQKTSEHAWAEPASASSAAPLQANRGELDAREEGGR